MSRRLLLAAALVGGTLAVAGCVAAPAPRPAGAIPVTSAETELEALTGSWLGEYVSVESGRSGRVRFSLVAGASEAVGDIRLFSRFAPATAPRPAGEATETIAIRFVRVHGSIVTGTTEPYRDPECGCLVSSSFSGVIAADSIEGRYVSQGGPLHVPHTGRWWARRTDTSTAARAGSASNKENPR